MRGVAGNRPGHDEAKRLPLRHHHGFRLAALALDHELVEGAEIGVGGRHERIRIGPLRGHGLSVLRQPEWHANAAGVVSLSLIAALPCGRRWRPVWPPPTFVTAFAAARPGPR